MPGSRTGARWVALLAGLLAVAVATWWRLPAEPAARPGPDARPGPPAPAAASPRPDGPSPPGAADQPGSVPPTAAPDAAAPLRVAAGSHARVAVDALPSGSPLALVLELEDEARGDGSRDVRLVSEDGRKLVLSASPLAGRDAGLRLEIDPDFLAPGRYLIEVQTTDPHPLHLRRYVLEVR